MSQPGPQFPNSLGYGCSSDCHLEPQLLLSIFIFPIPVYSSINASSSPFPSLVAMNFHSLWASPVPTEVNECFAIDFRGNEVWPFLFFLSLHPPTAVIYLFLCCFSRFFKFSVQYYKLHIFLIFLWPLYAL